MDMHVIEGGRSSHTSTTKGEGPSYFVTLLGRKVVGLRENLEPADRTMVERLTCMLQEQTGLSAEVYEVAGHMPSDVPAAIGAHQAEIDARRPRLRLVFSKGPSVGAPQ